MKLPGTEKAKTRGKVHSFLFFIKESTVFLFPWASSESFQTIGVYIIEFP